MLLINFHAFHLELVIAAVISPPRLCLIALLQKHANNHQKGLQMNRGLQESRRKVVLLGSSKNNGVIYKALS